MLTFTATGVPSNSSALWTCARLAAAIGSGSNDLNSCSGALLKSSWKRASTCNRHDSEKPHSVLVHWTVSLCLWCCSHLFVPPVQGLVFQYLQGADVLGGQEVVEGTQTLAELDVYSSVPDGAFHHVVCRPLVAGGHLGQVRWAALAGEDKPLTTNSWWNHFLYIHFYSFSEGTRRAERKCEMRAGHDRYHGSLFLQTSHSGARRRKSAETFTRTFAFTYKLPPEKLRRISRVQYISESSFRP